MKLVYVIAPFTGPTAWDIAENVRRAERAGLSIAKMGAMPVIPHANTHLFHGQCTADFWYRGTLALLIRCDAAFVPDPSKLTPGMRSELGACVCEEIPVFSTYRELRYWLRKGNTDGITDHDSADDTDGRSDRLRLVGTKHGR